MSEEIKLEDSELEKVTGGTAEEAKTSTIKTVICPKCGLETTADYSNPAEFIGFCVHCRYRLRAEDVKIVDLTKGE